MINNFHNQKLTKINIKEEYKYSKNDLLNKFNCNIDYLEDILFKFKYNDILKFDDDNLNKNYIKFTFVGVIIIKNYVVYCYPKYVSNFNFNELKEVINVIKRFKNDDDNVYIQEEINNDSSFNILPLILFFMNDYYENGLYSNLQEIIEINGNNEIFWDKTINHNQVILQNNKPYYYELLTKKRINDNNNYFRQLHKIILTKCSNDLKNADLLNLFGLTEIHLTDKIIDEFDNEENILNKINQELHCQYNTRKIELLNAMKLYVLNKSSEFGLKNCFSLYGTSAYYYIWEKLCCFVLNDLKDKLLSDINLPTSLNKKYSKNADLTSIIETPIWHSHDENGNFYKNAEDNKLKPDLITIHNYDNNFDFLIFDAKYYNLQLERDLDLKGKPGIESVTKQYLYQLAYKEFIELHEFTKVKNCFLFPTNDDKIINKGYIKLKMLNNLKLENIQIILLPAKIINKLFLDNEKLDINKLNLK